MQEIHQYDWGTQFNFPSEDDESGEPIDLTDVTNFEAILQRPDRTTFRVTPTVTDATAGLAHYVIQEGELDQAGYWKIQWVYAKADGSWSSAHEWFRVHRNIVEVETS